MSVERGDPRRCYPPAAITPLGAITAAPLLLLGGPGACAGGGNAGGRVLLPGNGGGGAGGGALLHRRPSGTGGAPGRWQRAGAGLVAPQATG